MPDDQWRQFVRHVLQRDAPVQDAKPTDTMLDTINISTKTLSGISEDFETLLDELNFRSFIEDQGMEGMDSVVSFDSEQQQEACAHNGCHDRWSREIKLGCALGLRKISSSSARTM